MKKIFALLMSVAMIASVLVLSAAAADPATVITPAILSDAGNTYNHVKAEVVTEGDVSFARLTTDGDDPWIQFSSAPVVSADAKYAAIKYRTTAACTSGAFYVKIAEPNATYDLNCDGNWNVVVCDLSGAGANWDGTISRFDPLNASSGGDVMDIQWIAVFASADDAAAYTGPAAGTDTPTTPTTPDTSDAYVVVIAAVAAVAFAGVVVCKKARA